MREVVGIYVKLVCFSIEMYRKCTMVTGEQGFGSHSVKRDRRTLGSEGLEDEDCGFNKGS